MVGGGAQVKLRHHFSHHGEYNIQNPKGCHVVKKQHFSTAVLAESCQERMRT